MHKSRRHRAAQLVCALWIGILVLVAAIDPLAAQTSGPPAMLGDQGAHVAAGEDHPRHCIDPIKGAHIAATLLSLLPLPGWSNLADAAAYAANLGLKYCPPELTPPDDIVVDVPSEGCSHVIHLPIPRNYADLVTIDREVMFELLNDPAILLSSSQRDDLIIERELEFGRFMNSVHDSYMNIYGIVLPGSLSEYTIPNWGDIGAPRVYHYNSDVFIEMTHPGTRINTEEIEVPVGNHTLVWEANTLVYFMDKFPTFLLTGAFGAYKAAQAKAAKRQAIKLSDTAFRKSLQQMLREGNRFFVKQVAKEIAQNAAITAGLAGASMVYKSTPAYTPGEYTGAETVGLQRLVIIDLNPPTISGNDPLTFEATDPGGMASARMLNTIRQGITVSDDCDPDPTLQAITPRFWPLLVDAQGNPLPSSEILWRASDNGAASAAGGVNTEEVTQQITIVDTTAPLLLPPPPVMMYAEDGGAEAPLGLPQVFDIVDLRPTINYDAPTASGEGTRWPTFPLGIHYVNWTATDQSQNTSEAGQQLVNIKAPGTNTVPTAEAQTGGNAIAAIADEPTRITIRGNDADVDPGSGMRDPIWFTIDEQPPHGFFIAPLYPYFVDDFRLTARYSPTIADWEGEEFAWNVAQDPSGMSDYMKSLCQANPNRRDLPVDFVNGVEYVAVDDNNYTFIYDRWYTGCNPSGDPRTDTRISVWDPQGNYVGQQDVGQGPGPIHSVKFDIAQGYVLAVSSDTSTTGTSVVDVKRIQSDNPDEPLVDVVTWGLNNKVNSLVVPIENANRTPEVKNATAAVWDSRADVVYVMGEQNLKGLTAFSPAPCDGVGGSPGDQACLDYVGNLIYSHDILQATKIGDFPGLNEDAPRIWRLGDIAVDSRGYVYVSANSTDSGNSNRYRIYRFEPAERNDDGTVTLGAMEGWMGRCDSGPNCNYIEGRSIGYSCTDDTCTVSEPTGELPGQFNSIQALAMDPNDVLYVADGGNRRVQRFSPDGLFAGEARSQDACEDCSGFVLGDFGYPGNITVNSSKFYILDRQEGLVHIFEASVVNQIDDASAWVEYQSKSNYTGADYFTFRATDGFHDSEGELVQSDPARIDINVARNFRPPIAAADLFAETEEDTPVATTLEGYDLDGDLDTLTYSVTTPPLHGTLSGNAPNLTYTPFTDFSGPDRFAFTLSDGNETAEPAIFNLSVTPVNDTPIITPTATTIRAGLGHAVSLDFPIFDPDPEDELRASVFWGDGSSQANGTLNMDGSITGPVVTPLINGEANLVSYHNYANAGTYSVRVDIADKMDAVGSAEFQISVEPMADLVLARDSAPVVPQGQGQHTYQLQVNNPTSGGIGIAAADVRVTETLTAGLTYMGAIPTSGTCQIDGPALDCNLGSISPDQSVEIAVQIALNGAALGTVIDIAAAASSPTPDPLPENNRGPFALAVVPVGDFYADSVRDGVDANPGDGVCATAEGLCTLRAAVMEANAQAGNQTIVLGSGVFVLEESASTSGNSAADDNQGDLDINESLVILGSGAEATTVHGNDLDTVFAVHNGQVRLENLTISGGNANAANGGQEGGGLLVTGGEVTLRQVSITGNTATNGGGIMHTGGTLRVIESAITGNVATGSGGGVMNRAELRLENVTLAGNQANDGGGLITAGGNAQLVHTTIVGNSATNAGGGINSTGGAATLANSILAGNDAPIGPDCAPELNSGGYNLIGTLESCTLTGDTGGNLIGMTPGLDRLTETEAQTYAYPLYPDSPAIERVAPGRCATNDQRGVARSGEAGCDMGAYETGATSTNLFVPTINR
ncbi:MAG: Ig-like domain-containing protein [Litorilinea sp.]